MVRDLKLIPAEEVPKRSYKAEAGMYERAIEAFIATGYKISYIEAEDARTLTNITNGLRKNRGDHKIRVTRFKELLRVYLIREDEG